MNFLKNQALDLGLPASVLYPSDRQNPVLTMTWQGSDPQLPSILLNSHLDVVPVSEEHWTYPPFGAVIDDAGNIYARGAQDMKSVGMQYLAAIRALKHSGAQFKRTIHLSYVSDEETGGIFGMKEFVKTSEFQNMNVGFTLDEGYPSASNDLEVFYTERMSCKVLITAEGHSGHGSILFNDTAAEKLNYVIDKFLQLRSIESRKLYEFNLPYGNVTTINLTVLKGGIKSNVVPPVMSAVFDIRLPMYEDFDAFERMVIMVQNKLSLFQNKLHQSNGRMYFVDQSLGKRSRK